MIGSSAILVTAIFALMTGGALAADYPSIEIGQGAGGAGANADRSQQAATTEVAVQGRYSLRSGEQRRFDDKRVLPRGERTTVFTDTYQVRYIEAMEPGGEGEQPVYGEVRFGRWLDLTVTGTSGEAVTVLVRYVHKIPVDKGSGEGPRVDLPQGDYRIVSRQVELPGDGEPVSVRVRDDSGELELKLRQPSV